MKKLAILNLLMCLAIGASAQQYFSASNNFSSTAKSSPLVLNRSHDGFGKSDGFRIPGERMRRTGSTLTILGGGLLTGGIVLASDGHTRIDPYTGLEVADDKLVLGTAMIVGGLGMIIPGAIFWSKGAKKYNRYMEQQKRTATLRLKGTGASVVFRF